MKWGPFSFGVTFVFLVVDNALGQPDVKEIEKQAITYRAAKVQRGYVRLHVANDISRQQQAEFLYEIIFDGDNIKQTRQSRLLGKDSWGYTTKCVLTQNQAILDDDPKLPINVVSSKQYGDLRERFKVINPQPLGMDLGGTDMLHVAQVESLLNRGDRSSPTTHPDVVDGLETFRIEYLLGKSQVKVWIAPSQGYGIVKAQFEASYSGKPYKRAIQTQLKQYPTDQVWYPQKLIKTEEFDGKLVSRQVVTVEEAKFGQTIDGTEFQLASLGVSSGRDVMDSTTGTNERGVWDGTKVVPPSGPDEVRKKVEDFRPPRIRWGLLGPAILLGVILVSVRCLPQAIECHEPSSVRQLTVRSISRSAKREAVTGISRLWWSGRRTHGVPQKARRGRLVITTSDGLVSTYSWQELRDHCPCAGCRRNARGPPTPSASSNPASLSSSNPSASPPSASTPIKSSGARPTTRACSPLNTYENSANHKMTR